MSTRIIECILALMLVSAPSLRAETDEMAGQDFPAQAVRPILRLNLKQAIDIALAPEGNPRVQLAMESVRQAGARFAQSRAALLPNVEAYVSQQNLTRNLQAFGIRLDLPIPGYTPPAFVGPFNVFDARATATQTIFDLSLIRRLQATRAGIRVAQAESESAEEQIRELVARAYLAAVRTDASLETARANVNLAEALLKLAGNQKTAGTGTGIEVLRARVQLANENQRHLVAENERRAAQLKLLKTMGLDLDAALELTERLVYEPVEPVTIAESLRIALESRADWKAQKEREETSRLSQSAVRSERLPSVSAFADYGTIGSSIHNAIPTRSYGVALRVPVFDGGRRDARGNETASQYRQERIRSAELRDEIELEIRLALDALHSAAAQFRTSEDGLALAEGELAQAQRRYQGEMTTNLEVTDAQTRLQRARENRIAALFSHNLARIDLAKATGTLRKAVQ